MDLVRTGPVVAQVLAARWSEDAGPPGRLPSLEALIEQCHAFRSARRRRQAFLAREEETVYAVFLAPVQAPIVLAEQLWSVRPDLRNDLRLGAHSGTVEIPMESDGPPVGPAYEGVEPVLEAASTGELFVSQLYRDLARQLPEYRTRFEALEAHGGEAPVFRFLGLSAEEYVESDLERAKAIHARAVKKGAPIAEAPTIARRLARIRRDFLISLLLVVVFEVIHASFMSTALGHKLEEWAYEQLLGSMPPPRSSKLSVTVIDLGDQFNIDRNSDRTDMSKVAELLTAIYTRKVQSGKGPVAIGIDLRFESFLGEGNLPMTPDGGGRVAEAVAKLRELDPPINTYLGISKPLDLPLDDALSFPVGWAGHLWVFGGDGINRKEMMGDVAIQGTSVPSLVDRLVDSVPDTAGWTPSSRLPETFVEHRYHVSRYAGVPLTGVYMLNFSPLGKLKEGTVQLESANDPGNTNLLASADDTVAIIGKIRLDSNADVHTLPSREKVAGIYLHALGVVTKLQEPIVILKHWLDITISALFALVVLIASAIARRIQITTLDEGSDTRVRGFMTVLLIVASVGLSFIMLRKTGVLWTSYWIVALALLVDPAVESKLHGLAHYLRHRTGVNLEKPVLALRRSP